MVCHIALCFGEPGVEGQERAVTISLITFPSLRDILQISTHKWLQRANLERGCWESGDQVSLICLDLSWLKTPHLSSVHTVWGKSKRTVHTAQWWLGIEWVFS